MPLTWKPLVGSPDDPVDEVYISEIYRAKIPGGWLVRVIDPADYDIPVRLSNCIVFVPDPRHEWDGHSLP